MGLLLQALKGETITVFGGDCCTPMALRMSDRTTTIRVNDVTITRIDGARLRIVNKAMN